MFKCECGSKEFYAHDDETIIVHYDGNGEETDGGEIVGAERPGWNKAFHCSKCDKAYSSLPPKNEQEEWERERVRWYLDKHGSVCPICECDAIEGGSLDSDGTTVWQTINCTECGAEWHDVYYLREVELISWPPKFTPKDPGTLDPNKEFKR